MNDISLFSLFNAFLVSLFFSPSFCLFFLCFLLNWPDWEIRCNLTFFLFIFKTLCVSYFSFLFCVYESKGISPAPLNETYDVFLLQVRFFLFLLHFFLFLPLSFTSFHFLLWEYIEFYVLSKWDRSYTRLKSNWIFLNKISNSHLNLYKWNCFFQRKYLP